MGAKKDNDLEKQVLYCRNKLCNNTFSNFFYKRLFNLVLYTLKLSKYDKSVSLDLNQTYSSSIKFTGAER